jgi:hypothetical protein
VQGHQFSRNGLKESTRFIEESAIHKSTLSEVIANMITKNRPAQTFETKPIIFGKVIHVSTKQDLHKPLKITNQKIETTNNLVFNEKIIVINPKQKRSRIIKKMQTIVLN